MLAESNLVMVHYSNAYFAARAFVENNPGAAILIGTSMVVGLAGIIGVMQLRRLTKAVVHLGKTRPMTTALEHERNVMQKVSDAICSGIEDAVASGEITRPDARRWYRRLGNIFDMKDLLPKGQSTLKEEIQERLAKYRLRRMIVIFPGQEPVKQETTPAVVKADNVVDIKPRLGSRLTGKVAS